MAEVENRIQAKAKEGKKQLAVLVDPDKVSATTISTLIQAAESAGVDYFFVGGSLISSPSNNESLTELSKQSAIPTIIFPGSPLQVSSEADAILFLSVISGRNAEALIGHHVIAAPYIKKAGLEVLPTGYMLIDCGQTTTAQYMSNSSPIPYNKPEIAAATALAGEMLGLRLIYMDGGSGADKPVSTDMISAVKSTISIPLMVGGGIRTPEKAQELCAAGADLLVVGNAVEQNPSLIGEISDAMKT